MSFVAKVRFYLRSLFQKRKLDEQLSEEVRTHVEMATEENVAKGMAPDEARYAALREFGNVASVQEQARDERGWVWLEQAMQDLRHAFRQLIRSPGFTAVVVLTLALGVGASTVLFSVVNAVFLRTLPVTDPSGLHLLTVDGPDARKMPFTQAYYDYFREHSQSGQMVAATMAWPGFRNLTIPGDAVDYQDEVVTVEVSGNYFTALGVQAVHGRLLSGADDTSGVPAAVISHALWMRRFGGDPAVIGREIRLDRFPVVVVGVAAPGYTGVTVGSRTDLWLPVQLSPRIDQNQPWGAGGVASNYPLFHLVARLAPGNAPAQAEAELTGLFRQQLADGAGLPPWVKPASKQEIAQLRISLQSIATGYGGMRNSLGQPIALLAGMVGALVLVACANIAGLLLVRGTAREREFALRSALGASRNRIMRQLLMEGFALALLGSLAAALVVWPGTRGLGRFLEAVDLTPNGRVLVFGAGVTALTGLAFGFLPAWRMSRLDLMGAAKGGPVRPGLSRGLVVFQIGLAFVLCCAAALIVQTFRNVAGIDAGFRPRELWAAPLVVPREATPAQRFELEHELREACLGLPGVRHVTFHQGLALVAATRTRAEAAHEIRESPAGSVTLSVNRVAVGPDFFATLGISLLQGSGFVPTDGAVNAPARVVLDERSAHSLFGGRNPIGQRISLWKEFEVIGVAADIKVGSLREKPKATVYLPRQAGPSTLQTTLMIRMDPGARLALEDIRALLRRLDPTATVSALVPVEGIFTREVRTEKLLAQLAACFALFVLLLACLGLFGLLAYSVARRTGEIGVRLALGASRERVLWLVLREGLWLVLIGSAMGIAGAAGLARFVNALLYGVSPTEPWVYGVVTLTLGGAALVACWLPARRATRVDPMIALRAE